MPEAAAEKPLSDFTHDQYSLILSSSNISPTSHFNHSNNEPAKRPAMSHGFTRSNPPNVDESTLSLFDKAESLKEAVTNILETTTWPGKSAAVAQDFLKAIKNTQDLRSFPEPTATSSPDLHNDAQQVI
ncbi:hypothetical protein FRC00_003977, partial [Tulasnella sp. 408]